MKNVSKLIGFAVIMGGLAGSIPAKANVYFRDNDRDVLRNYITSTPTPDTAVTFYGPGASLSDTTDYTEVPAAVTSQLSPPPAGDEYVTVGRNVYLIDRMNRTVVDALKLDE
jgi:hypothetical protein